MGTNQATVLFVVCLLTKDNVNDEKRWGKKNEGRPKETLQIVQSFGFHLDESRRRRRSPNGLKSFIWVKLSGGESFIWVKLFRG